MTIDDGPGVGDRVRIAIAVVLVVGLQVGAWHYSVNYRADYFAAEASARLEAGDHVGAIASARKSIRTRPTRADIHRTLVQAQLNFVVDDSTLEYADEAVELDPREPTGYFLRGQVLMRSGENTRAAGDFTEAIRLGLANDNVYSARGRVWKSLHDHESLIADYKTVIRLKPESAWLYEADLTLSHIMRGLAHAENDRRDLAIKDFDESIGYTPNASLAYLLRGKMLFDQGEYQRAIKDFGDAISRQLDEEQVDFEDLRKEIEDDGVLVSSIPADCAYIIELMIDVYEPKVWRARSHFWRGCSWQKLRDDGKAVADFNKAVDVVADFPAAYLMRGEVHSRAGQYEDAVADLSKAVDLMRSGRPVLSGDTSQERHVRALITLQNGRLIAPEDAYNALAWLLATCPEERYRDPGRALADARKACELSGWKNSRHLVTLSAAYAALGNFTEAKETLQRAIELDPQGESAFHRQMKQTFEEHQPYIAQRDPPNGDSQVIAAGAHPSESESTREKEPGTRESAHP